MPRFLAYAGPATALVGGWLFAVLWTWSVRLTTCDDAPCSTTAVAGSIGEDFAFGVMPVVVLVVAAAAALGPRVVTPTAAVLASVAVIVAAVGLFGVQRWTTTTRVSTVEIRRVLDDSTANPALASVDCAATTPDDQRMACAEDGSEKFLLGVAELTGADVETAKVVFTPTYSNPVVEVTLTDEGANRWAAVTEAAVGKRVAILVDGRVVSAPAVREPLRGKTFDISGGEMDRIEADDLAARIAGG